MRALATVRLKPDPTDGSSAIREADTDRFAFGRNWARYLGGLDEDRMARAERSLQQLLRLDRLDGRRFLDVGSGSGLFSLAARRLGASVHSFDYDASSVACTASLRAQYASGDPAWTVEQGSILDVSYVRSLGIFDVVYSWGVLHHTGDLWTALEHVQRPVGPGGRLALAIYNDMGAQSARWRRLKRLYNRLPGPLRPAYVAAVLAPQEIKAAARACLTLQPSRYLRSWTGYRERRGMSKWRDMVDWVGGYPYEVARPEQIFDFYRARGFTLETLRCGGVGLGCSEFMFQRDRSGERQS